MWVGLGPPGQLVRIHTQGTSSQSRLKSVGVCTSMAPGCTSRPTLAVLSSPTGRHEDQAEPAFPPASVAMPVPALSAYPSAAQPLGQ